MGIKIVREPSETPNINNTDDFVPFRYAYGNQDGYVIGKGNEVNIEQVDITSVLIKSGRFVVQGVEVDVDANGISVDFDDVPQNSDVFVTVYAEVNLATNSVSVQKVFDTVDYPAVEKGDDLTHITNGTANIEIAHIKLSNGSILNTDKTINPIQYSLNITKDQNGILRFGDKIIPQEKLLWEAADPAHEDGYTISEGIEEIAYTDIFRNKTLKFELSTIRGTFFCTVKDNGFLTSAQIPTRYNEDGSVEERIILSFDYPNTIKSGLYVTGSRPNDPTDPTIRTGTSFRKIYEIIE